MIRFSKGDSFLFGIFFLDFRLRFFETAEELFSTFRQQFLQLFFVATKFLFAVDAAQGHVRRIREAFGTGVIDDFPTDQKDQRPDRTRKSWFLTNYLRQLLVQY